MKLKVPIHTQAENSMLCGQVALQIFYDYYGIKKSIKQLLKEVKLYKYGTHVPSLGLNLIENGFDVTIYSKDSDVLLPSYEKLSEKQLVSKLKTNLKNKKLKFKRFNKTIIKFIEAGGKFKIGVVTVDQIKNELKNKRPSILNINCRTLYSERFGMGGHFVVSSGYDKDNIFVNDPIWLKQGKGIKKYGFNEMMFSIAHRGGYVLFAKKK
jgi:hypothetical protein